MLAWLWMAKRSSSKDATAERRGTGTVVSNAHTAKHKLPCSSLLARGRDAEPVATAGTAGTTSTCSVSVIQCTKSVLK